MTTTKQYFKVKNGLEFPRQDALTVTDDGGPSIRPSLLLDFAKTKKLDPRITFSRPTTATYYDGKTVAKAEENLLAYSQEFDNAYWSKQGATVSANTTVAPDGTTTADTLVCSGAAPHIQNMNANIGLANAVHILSVYVKPAVSNYITLAVYIGASNYCSVTFDVSSGVVTQALSLGSNISIAGTPSITPTSNGFYRLYLSFVPSQASFYVQYGVADAGTYSADPYGLKSTVAVGSSIYLWGAQLEQRSTATAYTPTTTAAITNYIPVLQTAVSNDARFDHDPVTGESKGLLIEEQRTNLLTYSSEFDNAVWSKTNATVTANAVVAPDGTLTGDKLIENTGNVHYFIQSIALASNAYTFTLYAKAAERNQVFLYFGSGQGIGFNLITGAVIQTGDADPDSYSSLNVGNGWWRLSITKAGIAPTNIQAYMMNAGSYSYTGDGYSGIYIWGAQLEAGSFPTSYIPTVASQVTRTADVVTMSGTNFSSWYRPDEGTTYIEMLRQTTTGYPGRIRFSDGTTNNAIDNYFDAAANSTTYQIISNGTTTVAIYGGGGALNTYIKTAFAYKTNDSSVAYDGAIQVTDTSCVIPSNINQVRIGNAITGHVKKVAYYPKRLVNAELQSITS